MRIRTGNWKESMLTEEEMTGINETMAALSSEINGNTGQKNIAALKRDWLKRNTELTLTQRKPTENLGSEERTVTIG